ncbi:MAG: AMP-binding protein [Pyrinomonadaceae bacterium]
MPNQSFCQRVADAAQARPMNLAMTRFGLDGVESVSFGSMLAQIRSIAFRLAQEGIERGDRVAIIGENHPRWAITYLGILFRGAVVTPLDPAASASTLAAFLGDAEAKLAFISPAAVEKFTAACDHLGRSIPAVAMQPTSENDGLASFADWSTTATTAEFDASPLPAQPDDLALLMYTSGTTGKPKAVPLTHGNIFAQSDKIQEVMHLSDREVILSLLPLFHAYSQIVNLWLATIIGARVVYLSAVGSAEVERGLKESGATVLVGVPRLWYLFHHKIFDAVQAAPWFKRNLFRRLLSLNGFLRDVLGLNAGRIFFPPVHRTFGGKLRLAVSAGASFDRSVAIDFHRLGFTILQGYGLTETSGAATLTRFEDNLVGSVGTPLNGVEVKIDEPNDAGIGEVFIRGPIVTPGYYHNPEANQEAFTEDRWFRSGDLGHFDRAGHLFIVGRKKDVIVLPSGKNVFPEDVEAQYERSPYVSELCVLGVKDESADFAGAEKLMAVVVPNFEHLKLQQRTNTREWVVWELENLGRELPEYQRVHDFILRAEPLPRTATRKVRRFELREQIMKIGTRGTDPSKTPAADFTPADRAATDSPAGRALAKAIRLQAPETEVIHPVMNLEIDLGLDSLARAECLASIEQALGVEFKPAEITSALTVGEWIALAQTAQPSTVKSADGKPALDFDWHDVLNGDISGIPEVQGISKPKPFTTLAAFLILKLFNFCSRFLFRLEVENIEVLDKLEPPYLICPNHQSFVDPVFVCSTYPHPVLKNIFHVGASQYFQGPITSRLARMINIVPIDPDVNLRRALRAGAATLRQGKILNIYPEGQRSFDGEMLEFRNGAAILATELDLPIVPVALDGAYRIWPRNSRRIRLAKLKIKFGEPINARALADDKTDEVPSYETVTAAVKESIQQMLDEMRSPS